MTSRSHPAYVTGVGAVMDTVVKFTAIDFLERLRPGGPWVLTAIVPDGPAGSTETITATSAAQVDAFILANDGKRNLYYSLNPTRGPMTKKAAKVDMDAVEYVHVDLDPTDKETSEAAKVRYLDAIAALETEPTFVIDSGNGIQALLKLAEPVKLPEPVMIKGKKVYSAEAQATIADVEARSEALMVWLGGTGETKRPFRKRLSGLDRRDSRGLLRPTPETPCGPQPPARSITDLQQLRRGYGL